jgi:uncharacterized protein YecE (DUF72 family)
MEIRIGTSGYSYPWNKGRPTPFEWYLNLGFPTVEINSSFYRFPNKSSVNTWKGKAPEGFDLAIKVNQSITHLSRFRESSYGPWESFRRLLKPIEDKIAFYLFQMPGSFLPTKENLEALKKFFTKYSVRENGKQAVIEFRDKKWWGKDGIGEQICNDLNLVFCSVDAPDLPRDIVASQGSVYLRIHGLKQWYGGIYPKEEILKTLERIKEKETEAKRAYVYLNHDEGMLPNGFDFLEALGMTPGKSWEDVNLGSR